jgi:tRNA(adenine34) deaminase
MASERRPYPRGREFATDEEIMRECLREAAKAAAAGEVPVGALVLRDGVVLGRGHNASIGRADPSAHAEIVALRAAAAQQDNYRLPGTELFVTVEPCLMCAGALVQARVERVVFACADPKGGALGSVVDVARLPGLNHSFRVDRGVCEAEARRLLQDFFRGRRRD